MKLSPQQKRSVAVLPRVPAAIVSRFLSGDSVELLAWDYDCPAQYVEDIIRQHIRDWRRRAGRKAG